MRDFHVHSTYSDGRFLPSMIRAAEECGLDAVGIADHCTVSPRGFPQDRRAELGFNLDATYERRSRGIDRLRETANVGIYDAVEMDYDPRDEDEIRSFLSEAAFDYVIGSIHVVGDIDIQSPSAVAGLSSAELDGVIDRYFENLIAMIESGLFDVAAHPDLFERTEPLQGRATGEHYHRAARAFVDSRTVPEINAGRALTESELISPSATFLDVLREHDVRFTVGSDAHRPGEIGGRIEFLSAFVKERDIETVTPPSVDS